MRSVCCCNRLTRSATESRPTVEKPVLIPPVLLIFAAPFPGWDTKLGILGLGFGVIFVNWLLMRHSKAILRAIGPVPLQLFGAVFGLLQLSLGLEFILDAWKML